MGNWHRFWIFAGLSFLQITLALPASAAGVIECRTGGTRESWKYSCTPKGGCEITAKPQSDKHAYAKFFKGADGNEFFSVAVGPSGYEPRIYYGFTQWDPLWQRTAPFGIDSALGTIDIDGKSLYAEKPPTGYVSMGKIQVKAAGQPIIDAMRHGTMLTANVRSKSGEELVTMTFPLKGFADAIDAGNVAEADTDAKIKAGAQCMQVFNPFFGWVDP